MQYNIKNTHLNLTVDSFGAQMISVKDEKGKEILWQADKKVWDYHAPVLFPYVGRIKDANFEVDGVSYPAPIHGFIRDVEHKMVIKEDNLIIFEYTANAESKKKFPFDFLFRSSYILSGHSVHHKIEVLNNGNKPLSFGFGFHPAFNIPFDKNHRTQDYYLEFDTPQSPRVLTYNDDVIMDGKSYIFDESIIKIPLSDDFLKNDSLIFSNLTAKYIAIVEKDTNRRIELDIQNFPYVAIWSPKTMPMQFLAIEPWMSLPDSTNCGVKWTEKKHCKTLEASEFFSVLSRIRIVMD